MPCSQPTCVPVRCRCSRSQSTSDVRAATWPVRFAPFTSTRNRDRAFRSLAPPSRCHRPIAARASRARRRDDADSRRWHGCRLRVRASPRRPAQRRCSIALSRRLPTSCRASSGKATGAGAAPPTPNVARVQAPVVVHRNLGGRGDHGEIAVAAADLEKRRSDPRARARSAIGFPPGTRPAAATVVIGPAKNAAAGSVRVPDLARSDQSGLQDSARPAAAPPTGRHAPDCRRSCRGCASACGRRTPAPDAAAARSRQALSSRWMTHCRVHAPMRTTSGSIVTNFSAAISLMSISQLGPQQPERHHGNEALSAGNDLRASPCCDNNSQASSIEAARAYSKGGDFNVRPQDAADPGQP